MPMLQVNRCPTCGKQSDTYDPSTSGSQLPDWITVARVNSRFETLCSWECVSAYADRQPRDGADPTV